MNRELHSVGHKLICLCAVLMKLMEILFSLGGSSSAESYDRVRWVWYSDTTAINSNSSRCSEYSNVMHLATLRGAEPSMKQVAALL